MFLTKLMRQPRNDGFQTHYVFHYLPLHLFQMHLAIRYNSEIGNDNPAEVLDIEMCARERKQTVFAEARLFKDDFRLAYSNIEQFYRNFRDAF